MSQHGSFWNTKHLLWERPLWETGKQQNSASSNTMRSVQMQNLMEYSVTLQPKLNAYTHSLTVATYNNS